MVLCQVVVGATVDPKHVDIDDLPFDHTRMHVDQHRCACVDRGFLEWEVCVVTISVDVVQDVLDVDHNMIRPGEACCPAVGFVDVRGIPQELQTHLLSQLAWTHLVQLVELRQC